MIHFNENRVRDLMFTRGSRGSRGLRVGFATARRDVVSGALNRLTTCGRIAQF